MKPPESSHSRRLPRWPRANRPNIIQQRQDKLRRLSHWQAAHQHVLNWPLPAEVLARFQECLTGHMVLPVGVVGPIAIDLGQYELDETGRLQQAARIADQVFVPLAHTEGGLSASVQRGVSAVALAGGIRTHVLADRLTRDSCFVFRSTDEALQLVGWVTDQQAAMSEWLRDPTRREPHSSALPPVSMHAILREVETHVVGPMCHVLYRFTTGDACGPNMMTRNAYALNQGFVLDRFPRDTGVTPLQIFLETNMGGDKKPSHAFFQFPGHGKVVMAEVSLSASVLRRVLRVSVDDVLALEHAGLHGAHASGMQSFAFTPASAVAAIFAATGQDLGMVGTSSMAHEVLSRTRVRTEDGVHISLRFSGLEVGTVGGGTSLPHAQSYLQLMDCLGPGKVYRFAQIIAATALCLEISATASMASAGSQNFARAHFERGGER